MKRYCLDCGAPTEYTLKKPIFCSGCGQLFEKSIEIKKSAGQVQKLKNTIISENYDIEDDYASDVKNVPNISSLEIETEISESNKGVKLKDLMGTSSPAKRPKNKIKTKKISKKQTLQDFAKEAGSLRKSNR